MSLVNKDAERASVDKETELEVIQKGGGGRGQ